MGRQSWRKWVLMGVVVVAGGGCALQDGLSNQPEKAADAGFDDAGVDDAGDTTVADGSTTRLEAPKSVEASGDRDDDISISWEAVDGADGYEVQRGEDAAWIDVGDQTSWVDTQAPAPAIAAGEVDVSLGQWTDFVELSAEPAVSASRSSVSYRVRAVDAQGMAGQASAAVSGHRSLGDVSYTWQRSDQDNPEASFADLTGLSCSDQGRDCEDDAIAAGQSRYYRVKYTAIGATDEVYSEPVRGARATLSFAFQTQPPSSVTAREVFGVEVGLQNQFGAAVAGYEAPVNISINPGEFTDDSTISAQIDPANPAVLDIAVDQAVEQADQGYVLMVSTSATVTTGAEVGSVESAEFEVVEQPISATNSSVETADSLRADGLYHDIEVSLLDPNGNPIEGVTLQLDTGAPATTAGTCEPTDADGQTTCEMASLVAGDKPVVLSGPGSTQVSGVVTFSSAAPTVAAGQQFSCAVDPDGHLWCWGLDNKGQLGGNVGTTDGPDALTMIGDAAIDWDYVSAGDGFVYGVRADQSGWGWGDNSESQLGDGVAAETNQLPNQISADSSSPEFTWGRMSAGGGHTCAIQTDGALYCWGATADGQVGNGSCDNDRCAPRIKSTVSEPSRVGTDKWARVAAAKNFTCGIKLDGTLWCWGSTAQGQLGIGGVLYGQHEYPVQVGQQSNWVDVSTGGQHACALRRDETLWCWGENDAGESSQEIDGAPEFGPVQITPPQSPTPIQPHWIAVGVGKDHSCAIRRGGSMWCWGQNDDLQLGQQLEEVEDECSDSGQSCTYFPIRVDVPAGPAYQGSASWVEVDGGATHSCGRVDDGSVFCWGSNYDAELGIPSPPSTAGATQIFFD